jgi:hypothetical protein
MRWQKKKYKQQRQTLWTLRLPRMSGALSLDELLVATLQRQKPLIQRLPLGQARVLQSRPTF